MFPNYVPYANKQHSFTSVDREMKLNIVDKRLVVIISTALLVCHCRFRTFRCIIQHTDVNLKIELNIQSLNKDK